MDIGSKELRKRLRQADPDRPARQARCGVAADRARTRGLPDLSVFRAGIKARGKPTSQLVIEERCKARY